jgi:hypothetical protein
VQRSNRSRERQIQASIVLLVVTGGGRYKQVSAGKRFSPPSKDAGISTFRALIRHELLARAQAQRSRAQAADEVGRIQVQRRCKPKNIDERNIAFTTLERTDIGSMHATRSSKHLLA